MTTAQAPTRNRGNRRAEILAAAASLFAARGFHGVSIEDIGGAVGISGPALYRHFSGKDALLAEMLLDISSRLRESAVAVGHHGRAGRARRSTRCCTCRSRSRWSSRR